MSLLRNEENLGDIGTLGTTVDGDEKLIKQLKDAGARDGAGTFVANAMGTFYNVLAATCHPLHTELRLHGHYIRHDVGRAATKAAKDLGRREFVSLALASWVSAAEALKAETPEKYCGALLQASQARLELSLDAPARDNATNHANNGSAGNQSNSNGKKNKGGGKRSKGFWNNGPHESSGWNNTSWGNNNNPWSTNNSWGGQSNKSDGKGKKGGGKKGQQAPGPSPTFDNGQASKIPFDAKQEIAKKCRETNSTHVLKVCKCPHGDNCKQYASNTCSFCHDPTVKPVYNFSNRASFESLEAFYERSAHEAKKA